MKKINFQQAHNQLLNKKDHTLEELKILVNNIRAKSNGNVLFTVMEL